MAKKYANFVKVFDLFGLEDGNTQELQAEIPSVVNPEDTATVVDKLGDTYEVGNMERSSGDVDYIPEELQAEIDAIEKAAEINEQVGAEIGLMEEDPYHEIPGGVDMTNGTDEKMKGFDEVQEYAASVNEIQVTGSSPNIDEFLRTELDENGEDPESGITAPGENQAELDPSSVDAEPLGGDLRGLNALQEPDAAQDIEEVEVEPEEVQEEAHDDALDISEITGTESEDFEIEDEETEEVDEEIEEAEEETEAVEEEVEEVEEESAEEVEEEIEEVEEETEEVDEEIEEVEVAEDVEDDEIPADSCCAEEYAILGELGNVELDDNPVLTPEQQEEAEQAAQNVELGEDSAFAAVSEMQDVNAVDGETPEPLTYDEAQSSIEKGVIDEDTLMSDVINETVADDSHGEDDAYWDGDVAADGEGEVSEGEGSYDVMDRTSEEYHEGDTQVETDVEGVIDGDEEIADPVDDEDEYSEETEEDVEADTDGDGDIDVDDVEDMAPDSDDVDEDVAETEEDELAEEAEEEAEEIEE